MRNVPKISKPKDPGVSDAGSVKKVVATDGLAQSMATVPHRECYTSYVPRSDADVSCYETYEYARRNHVNVLITGDTGTGKTSSVLAYSAKKKRPFYSISSSVGLEPSQLFGRYIPDEKGGFVWCVSGDTEIGWVNNRPGKPQTIEQLYNLLHGRLDTSDGLCVSCGVNYRPIGRWLNSPVGDRCQQCRKFRGKVSSRGNMTVLGRRGDRLFPELIQDVVYQGVREVVTVTTVGGRSLTSTLDHRHLTKNGWIATRDLYVGDYMAVREYREVWSNPRNYAGVHVPKRDKKSAADGRCEWCGNRSRLDFAHLDGDTANNTDENTAALCRSCHLRHDIDTGQRSGLRNHRGVPIGYEEIASIIKAPDCPVFDIVMDTEDHSWVANGFVTHNCDGPVTHLVRTGGVLLINEINFIPDRVSTVLFSLLDKRRVIQLVDHKGEVIEAHNDLLIIADMNPGYAGTRDLNAALRNRFAIQLYWDYDTKVEKKLMPGVEALHKMAKLLRDSEEVSTPVSTNMLMDFVNQSNSELGFAFAQASFVNRFRAEEAATIRMALDVASVELKRQMSPEDAKRPASGGNIDGKVWSREDYDLTVKGTPENPNPINYPEWTPEHGIYNLEWELDDSDEGVPEPTDDDAEESVPDFYDAPF